jgi:uncharacterized membrane protein
LIWSSTYRLRQTLRNSLWIVPTIYVAAALVLSYVVPMIDETNDLPSPTRSADSTRDVLSAIATGMLAFTGFVLAIVLLLVQFGTATFGPRLVRWARQNWLLKHALGVFAATSIFSLFAITQVERDDTNFVPDVTLDCAMVLLLASIVLFFFLLDNTSNAMRPAAVAEAIARKARVVLASVYPALDDGKRDTDWVPPTDQPVREVTLRHSYGASLTTIDRRAVVRWVRATGTVVELVPAIGEHVRQGTLLFRIYGGEPRDLRRLERAVVLGDERNLDDDPAFAFRLLVDTAVKALSPAINDPSTAVQVLDWIEGLLRDAAPRELGGGEYRDETGAIRIVYRTSTWEDLVGLAFEEILFYGRTAIQVQRRMRAIFDGLIADLPEHRRPAIVELRSRLALSVAEEFPLRGTRTVASHPDRLGLGMAERGG